jgi:hypothetical protein
MWTRLKYYFIIIFLSLFIAGLFITNYSACLALVAGILVAGILLSKPAKVLLSYIISWVRKWKWVKWVLLILIVFFLSLALPPDPRYLQDQDPPDLEKYSVIIEPVDSKMERFKINETINISNKLDVVESDRVIHLSGREVTSSNRGLLLKEIHIAPLQANSEGYVDLNLPNGKRISGYLCTYYCPESKIKLRDFPKNSFYDAKNDVSLKRDSYIDIETITWSVSDLNEGIKFSYISPPYYYLLPLVKPFVGISSLSELIIVLLGIIGGLIVTPIVGAFLSNLVKSKIKSRFEKPPKKKQSRRTTLIVSSKGEEKVIEIDEDESN